jgi:hypothetical protein
MNTALLTIAVLGMMITIYGKHAYRRARRNFSKYVRTESQ